ncbi:MAG: glycine zipper 2TM domain-containing protein [Thioalkalispiraceae bacterium]|jgi:uncharacterized protein YcfJ
MKKVILASIIGVMSLSVSNAYAGHGKHKYRGDGFYDRARVTHVEPVYTTVRVSVPVQECYQQEVRSPRYHHDDKAASTVVGAIIGGAIGHNVGKHRKAPTVAGAIIGGAIGNELAKNRGHRHEYVRYEDVCETRYTYEEEQRVDGYNVTYRYKGEVFTTYMKHHPGKRLRVKVRVSPVVD